MGRATRRAGDCLDKRRGALSAKTCALTIRVAAGRAVHRRAQDEYRSNERTPVEIEWRGATSAVLRGVAPAPRCERACWSASARRPLAQVEQERQQRPKSVMLGT